MQQPSVNHTNSHALITLTYELGTPPVYRLIPVQHLCIYVSIPTLQISIRLIGILEFVLINEQQIKRSIKYRKFPFYLLNPLHWHSELNTATFHLHLHLHRAG